MRVQELKRKLERIQEQEQVFCYNKQFLLLQEKAKENDQLETKIQDMIASVAERKKIHQIQSKLTYLLLVS